jgi:membrane peptidoglycan carboxypeptidase
MTSDPPTHAAPSRPISDRWSFKPVALLLLFAVLVASAGVMAVVISPPFLAAGLGVQELQSRLDAAGQDFTRIPRLPQRSTIYANDGRTVLAHVYLDNREIVPLRQISPIARRAVLAIEDAEFYEHGAVNLMSLIRAAIENARAGDVVQGGSTITQQLVKNTLGLDPSEQSLTRKFQELALAQRVEQRYTKNKILELYLNDVFLGNNMYGIGTASRFYFRKPASQLTLSEAALLAGLIRSPSNDDPIDHPHEAYLRRNDVLNRMIALGSQNGGITAKRGEAAKELPLGITEDIGATYLPTPPFLVSYVKQQLADDPNGWYTVLGDTARQRTRSIAEGGFDIITTLDPAWQKAAQKAASAPWAVTPSSPGGEPEPEVAIVSLETHTGAITTMLSGRDYERDQINTVTTAHQPGSSFKPYVLATAFEQGIPPTATYSGAQGPIPGCVNADGSVWNVTNAEGSSRGTIDLYEATADSVNAVFARLIVDAGPANVVELSHRVGVTSPLGAYCALATGSVGITPLDQASGYQTFANSGLHCAPFAVSEIRRNQNVLYQQVPDCTRVVSADIANLVTDLLKGPVTSGTASSTFASGWGDWPLAGKTGTADSNFELWFAGYTRQVTTAVWVGSPQNPYPMPDYWGYSVFGGTIAAPIWKAYMVRVMEGMPSRDFPPPKLARVPSVIGMTQKDAIATLKEARFKVETKVIDSFLPKGTVAEQTPPAGVETIPGITVLLSISNGVAPHVTLPSVKGLSVSAAQAALSQINITSTVVKKSTNDPKLDGVVYGMNPDAGSSVLEGSGVTLFVWDGPASPAPSPSPSPNPGGNGNGGGGNGNGGKALRISSWLI